MLFEIIELSSGQLNSGVITQQLTDVELSPASQVYKRQTRPVSVIVDNASGKSVSIGLWTTKEYSAWTTDESISDLFAIDNGDVETFTDPKGEIEYITASGTTGHTGSVTFTMIRE